MTQRGLIKLELFLIDIFDTDHLISFLTRSHGRALVAELPGLHAPSRQIAHAAVQLLSRRGLIDQRLFDALIAEFPNQEEVIRPIAADFNLQLTRPTRSPPSPPREETSRPAATLGPLPSLEALEPLLKSPLFLAELSPSLLSASPRLLSRALRSLLDGLEARSPGGASSSAAGRRALGALALRWKRRDQTRGEPSDIELPRDNRDALLDDALHGTGLLTPVEQDQIAFAAPVLQDLFAALALVELGQTPTRRALEPHLRDPAWSPLILLRVGLSNTRDEAAALARWVAAQTARSLSDASLQILALEAALEAEIEPDERIVERLRTALKAGTLSPEQRARVEALLAEDQG